MRRRSFLGLALLTTASPILRVSTFAQGPTMFNDRVITRVRSKYGELAVRRLHAWQTLINDNLRRPERLQLTLVNDFFSEVVLASSQEVWGVDDYWATPVEFLAKDAGSAVDFVTAKYFTLTAMGVEESKIYFTYVTSTRLRRSHVVLTYFRSPRSEPLILDSLTDRILPASQRSDLRPIYSFNAQGSQEGERIDESALGQWNRMLERMRSGTVN